MCKCMRVGVAKFALIREGAKLPKYMSMDASCCDVVIPEAFEIQPQQQVKVPLGLIAVPPFGFHWRIHIRSSIAKYCVGLRLANCEGIIDSDYSGPNDEMIVYLFNANARNTYQFDQGQRLFQLELIKSIRPSIINKIDKSNLFKKTSRGGFGSTGVT